MWNDQLTCLLLFPTTFLPILHALTVPSTLYISILCMLYKHPSIHSHYVFIYVLIRELVDSLYRKGSDAPIHQKSFITCKHSCSKPLWGHSSPLPLFLCPMIPLAQVHKIHPLTYCQIMIERSICFSSLILLLKRFQVLLKAG